MSERSHSPGVALALGLPERLRAIIAPAHVQIEQTAIAQAMQNGRLNRAWYLVLLRHLLPVHHELDARLPEVPVLAAHRALIAKSDALRRDLEVLGCARLDERPLDLVDWLATADPSALIGAAYVVAGSSLGAEVIRPGIGRTLGLADAPDQGLDFLRAHPRPIGPAWSAFRGMLARLDEAEHQRVLAGAVMTMDGLRALYDSLPDPEQRA